MSLSASPGPAVPHLLIEREPACTAAERSELIETLIGLCEIESTTGMERAVTSAMEAHLRRRGYHTTSIVLDEAAGRRNLLATTTPLYADGKSEVVASAALSPGFVRPRVILTTHLDTVPPYLPPKRAGDRITGRGSCDAKGSAVAMILAAERLRRAGRDDVGLLFVVSEETDSAGAKRVAEVLPFAPDCFIDGEPTDNVLVRGSKGLLRWHLLSEGVLGHSAYPDVGRSAVHQLIGDLSRLLAAELPGGPFGPTTLNVGLIGGGRAANVIADLAEADVLLRLGTDTATVEAALRPLLSPHTRVEGRGGNEPLDMLVPAGLTGKVVSFGTDVPHLRPLAPSALVGPGSILDAHTDHEFVTVDDLEAAVRLYAALAADLCPRNP
jgi:acetylornithine deacetylase